MHFASVRVCHRECALCYIYVYIIIVRRRSVVHVGLEQSDTITLHWAGHAVPRQSLDGATMFTRIIISPPSVADRLDGTVYLLLLL